MPVTNDKIDITSSDYHNYLSRFLFNIQTLKIYTQNVGPVLKKITNKKKFDEVKKVNQMVRIVKHSIAKNGLFNEKNLNDVELIKNHLEDKYNIKVINETTIRGSGVEAVKFFDEIKHFDIIENQINIMYQSSLINLIVFFEILIGSIIKNRLFKYPKSNEEIEKKTLKLKDIRKLGSLENAESFLIEAEVETILRKSYTDWIDYIKENNNNIKLEFLDHFNNEILEIFQRRNLFVHNEGKVNNTYLTNVDSTLTKNMKLNDYLTIDKENLDRSIELIEHVGILLCLEVWSYMEKKSEERIDFVIENGYSYMLKGQWSIVKNMFKSNLTEKNISSDKRTISQLNYWLAMKELGFNTVINEEIIKADFSDKSLLYQLCLFALKEDTENFFRILPQVISKNEISYKYLNEFPILKCMRQDERFNIALESMNNEKTVATEEMVSAINEVAVTADEIMIDAP